MAGIGPIDRLAGEGGAEAADRFASEEHAFASAALGKHEPVREPRSPPYRYQDKPPIAPMQTRSAIRGAATRFRNTVLGYRKEGGERPVEPPPARDSAAATLARERWEKQNAAWGARAADAYNVAGSFRSSAEPGTAYAYRLGDEPVGLMDLVEGDDHSEINWLATHPGASGAGQALVERAVDVSDARGHGGIVRTYSMSDASTGFYRSMGFRERGGNLRLDPGGSGNWTRNNGAWSLTANQNRGHLVARVNAVAVDPAPPAGGAETRNR